MKNSLIVLALIAAFFVGGLVSTPVVEGATSVKALQNEIAKLKKEIKVLKENAITKPSVNVQHNGKVYGKNVKVSNKTVPAVINFKGVTYSPTKFVMDTINSPYSEELKKKIIYIGPKPAGVDMTKYVGAPYYAGNGKRMNENTSLNGIRYPKSYELYRGSNEVAMFNLEGKYKTLTTLIGFGDLGLDYNQDTPYSIYGDGKLLNEYTFTPGELAREITINVKGVRKLEVRYHSTFKNLVLANPVLK